MVPSNVMARPGFSLIDTIIALMIVAMMVVLGLGGMKWVERSRRTKTDVLLQNLRHNIETYRVDTNVYPTSLHDLAAPPTDAKVAKKWKGGYLDQSEIENESWNKDGWGTEFVYQLTSGKSNAHPYELYSWGKHGEGSPQEEWISVW